MAYFKVIHNRRTDEHRWQLIEDNNKVISHGETHPSRANVIRAISGLAHSASEAASREVTFEEESGED